MSSNIPPSLCLLLLPMSFAFNDVLLACSVAGLARTKDPRLSIHIYIYTIYMWRHIHIYIYLNNMAAYFL
jgi:hypothetical protein